jgi:hypothetical protein
LPHSSTILPSSGRSGRARDPRHTQVVVGDPDGTIDWYTMPAGCGIRVLCCYWRPRASLEALRRTNIYIYTLLTFHCAHASVTCRFGSLLQCMKRRTVIRRDQRTNALSRPWRSTGTSRDTETRRVEAKAWWFVHVLIIETALAPAPRSIDRLPARAYWLLVNASGLSGIVLHCSPNTTSQIEVAIISLNKKYQRESMIRA